jgi:hypothetical protein
MFNARMLRKHDDKVDNGGEGEGRHADEMDEAGEIRTWGSKIRSC